MGRPVHHNPLHRLLKACVSSSVLAWVAMSGMSAHAAPDPCTVDATSITCEGNQSAGIGYGTNVHTEFNVRNLTHDITPTGHGIYFINTNTDINANIDLGEHRIVTSNGNRGIWLRANQGNITLNHSGDIQTAGDYGVGIQLDSNGNSGANPNMTVNTTAGHIQTSGGYAHGMYLYVRGTGLGSVNNAADITTTGNTSRGIYINSGAGSSAVNSGTIVTSGAESQGIYLYALTGDTSLVNTGHLETSGQSSYAFHIVTQNGLANADHSGSILTHGNYAHGFIAASGRGDVYVNSSGTIETEGSESTGIYVGVNYGVSDINVSGDVTTSGAGSHGIRSEGYESLQNVVLGLNGTITTTGRAADGIYLNTYASNIIGTSFTRIDGNIQTTGDYAEGLASYFYDSPVDTTLNGDINTQGYHSYGAVVQSSSAPANFLIDGTGTIYTRGDESVGLFQETTGEYTNTVTLGSSAAITTNGTEAHGIQLRSDSEVNVNNAGAIRTHGYGATALYIETAGNSVINNSGALQGGSGAGWAFYSAADSNTDFTNSGLVFAPSLNAMRFGDGDDTVTNTGTISGNVDMGGGVNIFLNDVGGFMEFADSFHLGAYAIGGGGDEKVGDPLLAAMGGSSLFTNAGTAYVSGNGTTGTTNFYGDFLQTSDGMLVFDADAENFTADYLRIFGAADLSGTILMQLHNVPTNLSDAPDFPNGEYSFAILYADALTTGEGLTFDPTELSIQNTVAYTFALRSEDNYLWVDVLQALSRFDDMLDGSETGYQKQFAAYLDAQQEADDGDLTPLIDTLRNLPDTSALKNAFDQFAPNPVIAQQRFLVENARGELAKMPGCKATSVGALCVFGGLSFGEYEGDIAAFGSEYATDAKNLHLGLGLKLSENWDFGARVTLGDDDVDLPGEASGEDKRLSATFGLEGKMPAGMKLNGTLLAGGSDGEFSRASLLSSTSPLVSQQETTFYGGAVRLSKTFTAKGFGIMPDIGASWVCVESGGYAEAGTSADAIKVDAWDSCQRAIGPGLGLASPGFSLGAFNTHMQARIGVEALEDDGLEVSARLKQAPILTDRYVSSFEGEGSTRTTGIIGLTGASETGWQFGAGAEFSDTDAHSGWTLGVKLGKAL